MWAPLPNGVQVINDSTDAARLHECVISGDLPQLLQLLRARVNPNETDRTGQAPLHRAAHGLGIDTTRALLAAKAAVDAVTVDNRSALHKVAISPHTCVGGGAQFKRQHALKVQDSVKVARMILEAQADPNLRSGTMDPNEGRHNETPLHVAAALGRRELADVLLQAGADINLTTKSGLTPLDNAEGRGVQWQPGWRCASGAVAIAEQLRTLQQHAAQAFKKKKKKTKKEKEEEKPAEPEKTSMDDSSASEAKQQHEFGVGSLEKTQSLTGFMTRAERREAAETQQDIRPKFVPAARSPLDSSATFHAKSKAEVVVAPQQDAERIPLFPARGQHHDMQIGLVPGSPSHFSKKDAKVLSAFCSRRGHNIWDVKYGACLDKRAKTTSFWEKLVAWESIPDNDFTEIHKLVIFLLFTFYEFDRPGDKDLHASTQSAALAVVRRVCPDSLLKSYPFALPPPSDAEDGPRLLGAIPVGSKWNFIALQRDPGLVNRWDLHPGSLPYGSCYQPLLGAVTASNGDARFPAVIETGAVIHVVSASIRVCLERRIGAAEPSDVDLEDFLTEWFGRADTPGYGIPWARSCWKSGQLIVVMRKLLGQSHPSKPYAVASNVIVLEDTADIAQVQAIARQLGLDDSVFSIPLAFPPCLSDADRRMQLSYLMLAAGAEGGDDAVLTATQELAAELVGDAVFEFDEDALHKKLADVEELVRKAMLALRHSQSIAEAVLRDVIDRAWDQIKIRHEWTKREAMVREWSFEKKRASKNKKVKQKLRSETSKQRINEESFDSALEQLERCAHQYQHVSKGLVALADAGLARLTMHENDSEVLVQITPPRTLGTGSSSRTSGGQRKHPKHFLAQIEDAIARDRQFAAAHSREVQRKLVIQERLEFASAVELSLQDPGNGERL